MRAIDFPDLYRPGAYAITKMNLGYEPHPLVVYQEKSGEVIIIRCDEFPIEK